jgi:Cof subfamily protein (haloacid dehalogenase superfamily)
MQKLKLVAIDLDKTLLRADKTYDAERFNKVRRALTAKGVLFAIISGHSRQDTEKYLAPMNREAMYIATHNGNHVVYNHDLVKKVMIPSPKVREALNSLDVLGRQSILFDDGREIYRYKTEKDHLPEINKKYPEAREGGASLLQKDRDLFKIAVYTDKTHRNLHSLASKLRKKLPEIDVVARYQGWLEFHFQTCGKGKVIETLQKQYNISSTQTLSFGDKSNDLSMNDHVEFPIAMGNASEEYKASTPYLIGTNEEQAVIDLLEELNQVETLAVLEKYRVQ